MVNYHGLVIGDTLVGKTSFLQRHLTGRFNQQYLPTEKSQVTPLTFHTTSGPITFQLFEYGLIEQVDCSTKQVDCLLFMFDVTAPASLEQVIQEIKAAPADLPKFLCANKVDAIKDRVLDYNQINARLQAEQLNLPWCELSVRSLINIEKPLLYLARQLTNSQLDFTTE